MALVGDRYTATASGTYTLRFYMMDDDGQTLATSAPYTVRLDFTTESSIRKQAWMGNPDGSGPVYGTLEGLLALAPTGSTIYLLTGDIIILSGGASQLSGVQLAADPGVFAISSCAVRVTTQSPLDGSAGLFVYVEEVTAGEETATLTLQAACDQVLDGSWLTTAPTFTLSSDVELPQGWTWAVRYDGGAPVTLAGNTFTAQEEGAYTLTFVVLDGAGQVAASTQDVTLRLDTTPPLVQATAGANLTLTVTALGETFDSEITHINRISASQGSTAYYTVTCEMDVTEDVLPGMAVTVTIPRRKPWTWWSCPRTPCPLTWTTAPMSSGRPPRASWKRFPWRSAWTMTTMWRSPRACPKGMRSTRRKPPPPALPRA